MSALTNCNFCNSKLPSMEGSSQGLRKGAWTAEEDSLLKQCIDTYGEGKWHQIPLRAGLNRCRKSCRLRWLNYLKPSINRGRFSFDEVDLLLRLHKLLGNRWSLIAGRLPGRTANDVKNYWNTHIGKKQEPCCKRKMRKREITSSATTLTQSLNAIRPRPRSFISNNIECSQLNGPPEVVFGQASTKDGSITSNKDVEKYEFANNLIGEENMWWESLLEESQVEDALMGCASATVVEADNSLMDSMSSTFEVEKLWSLFNEDTREVEIQKNLGNSSCYMNSSMAKEDAFISK